ncbi:MAG: V-type ATP synthase subunit I [Christensenellales bacterium]|jgi:V/A-type H+-transporting ATPase subunit I
MGIVNVRKMTLVGLQRDRKALLKLMQRLGLVHVTAYAPEAEEPAAPPEDLAAERDAAARRLARYEAALEFYLTQGAKKHNFLTQRPTLSAAQLEARPEDPEVLELIRAAEEDGAALAELRAAQARLKAALGSLAPWRGLSVPVERLGGDKYVSVRAGTLPFLELEALRADCADLACDIDLVLQAGDLAYLLVIAHRADDEAVFDALKARGYSAAAFQGVAGYPRDQYDRWQAQFDELERKRQATLDDAAERVEAAGALYPAIDALRQELERAEVACQTGHTQATFLLTGYVAHDQTDQVEARILEAFPACYIAFEQPSDEEIPPTLIRNPKLIRPFEAVTGLYATPAPRSLDPNPLMAPFFFAFFGMMLSDAGYGLIMAIVCAFVSYKIKPKGSTGQLVSLLALGGVSTLIWGALFGGWFGVTLAPLWFVPMEEPLKMLILCFALGGVQVVAGLLVMAYLNISRGDVWAAVFDQFSWIVLMAGLLLLVFEPVRVVGAAMAIGGVLVLLCTQGRHEKKLLKKITKGLSSLYDITSYLSDILSYSRLFALGLATGVIGMVVNTIAGMLAGNVVGYIFMAVILVFGHTLNLVINALGAYVHASRLQFIEFFGKFFEEGGYPFSPFAIKTTYVDIDQ